MLPASDATFLVRGTKRLEATVFARILPVAALRLAVLDIGAPIGLLLAGGAAIDIVGGNRNEILLAEAAGGFRARGLRPGQHDGDAGILAGLDLLALVVAAVGHHIERRGAQLPIISFSQASWTCPVGSALVRLVQLTASILAHWRQALATEGCCWEPPAAWAYCD